MAFFLGWVRKQGLQAGNEVDWQGGQLALTVDGGMDCVAPGQEQFPACCFIWAQNFVGEFAGDLCQLIEPGFDDEQVVIAGRRFKASIAFDDREDEAQFFYLPVGTDILAHQFGAADFKKAEVVGVIDDSCGVGISIEDPVLAAMIFVFHFVGAFQMKFLFFKRRPLGLYR